MGRGSEAVCSNFGFAYELMIHREDKSFDLLDLSCLKTPCGGVEYRKVRFTLPCQRSNLYPVLKLYYFNVPEE